MVKIGNKPLLLHIIELYLKYNYKDFYIALGYKSNVVTKYFKNFKNLNKKFQYRINNKFCTECSISGDNIDKYVNSRMERIKMINRRSKLNYYIFHLSNPILVLIRNLVLKFFVKNKSFLDKYLGQIYNYK